MLSINTGTFFENPCLSDLMQNTYSLPTLNVQNQKKTYLNILKPNSISNMQSFHENFTLTTHPTYTYTFICLKNVTSKINLHSILTDSTEITRHAEIQKRPKFIRKKTTIISNSTNKKTTTLWTLANHWTKKNSFYGASKKEYQEVITMKLNAYAPEPSTLKKHLKNCLKVTIILTSTSNHYRKNLFPTTMYGLDKHSSRMHFLTQITRHYWTCWMWKNNNR